MAQTLYLTEDETIEYCDMLPITMSQVAFASAMIDSYIGMVNTPKGKKSKFSLTEITETLRPNRKHVVKLKYAPIVLLLKVEAMCSGYFGATGYELDTQDLFVDEYGYLEIPTFNADVLTKQTLLKGQPKAIKVTYLYGYEEIPENIKRACAMIAMNISQTGTFVNIESMTTLDARWSLTNPSVFTDDIKNLLSEYRL